MLRLADAVAQAVAASKGSGAVLTWGTAAARRLADLVGAAVVAPCLAGDVGETAVAPRLAVAVGGAPVTRGSACMSP